MYNSQWEQDKWLNENIFKNKRNGFFVDIGAHDGVSISNSYFFEKELTWKGICIEPIPRVYQKLKKNRTCECIHGCIYNRTGTVKFQQLEGYTEMLSGIDEAYNDHHRQRVNKELDQHGGNRKYFDVNCFRLEDILEDRGIKHVDYISIDTEGSEMQVLEGINFDKVEIDVIEIEVNYRGEEEDKFNNYLDCKGFVLGAQLTGDNIYISRNFLNIQ